MLTVLRRTLRLLELLIEWVVVALMVALVAIVSLQFIDRHFLDTGIAAPDQYARVALVWLTCIGFAIAVRAGLNVRVDLIDSHLPSRARRVLELAFDALMLMLTAILLPGSWRLIEIGRDQLLLGTSFTAAVPAAGAFIAWALIVLFVALRFTVRLLHRELPGPEEV
ncbi:MAG TPA: TRAP transporter small permease subunit [Burkholderiales bacterium]|nr:TRAP transporter small permease subunit [Burkholderiales bacterium]